MGLGESYRAERNLRWQLFLGSLALTVGFLAGLGPARLALILLVSGLVWGLEVVNTALESAVDLASPEWRPLARRAKDAGAGAVLLAAGVALGVAALVLLPALADLRRAGDRLTAHPTAAGVLAALDFFLLWSAGRKWR